MSNQDPFNNRSDQTAQSFGQSSTSTLGDEAAQLRQAGDTVRSDLASAKEQAKADLHSAADQAKQDFAALKEQASSQFQGLKSQATSELSNLRSQAEGQLGEAAEKAKAFAGEQVNQLTDRARSFATEQKDLAAKQIGGVVDAVSRVADELRENDSAVAGYAQSMAGSLRQLADSVQNKSVDDLVGMAQDFGRRQPLAFVGIAALAGFAASRFLLASAKRQDDDWSDQARRSAGSGRRAQRPGDDYQVDFERDTSRADLTPMGMTNNGRL